MEDNPQACVKYVYTKEKKSYKRRRNVMKKTYKVVLVLLMLLVLATSLTACGGPKKEDIVGHWEVHDRVINFSPDGTFSMSSSREWAGGGLETQEDLDDYIRFSKEYTSEGSWTLHGNIVKTETNKFGFIDFTYKDGQLIDGDDVYTKKEARLK